jgi:hypothetical protein
MLSTNVANKLLKYNSMYYSPDRNKIIKYPTLSEFIPSSDPKEDPLEIQYKL